MKSMLQPSCPRSPLAAAAAAQPGQHRCARAGQDHHPVLGRLGPGQRAGRAVEGLHRQDRRQDEVRVRAVAELCRPHAQRAQLQGQAVRPDHRRQPVDRRRGRERPLRQAQRLLRQGRHQDDRLRAGHRGRLRGVAEEHAELLGAAGDGRCSGLDLPQGLVRQARTASRVQEEVQPRPRAAEDMGRVQGRGRVLPGPDDRRQEGLRHLPLHRARLRRHHDGRVQRAVPDGLQVPGPEEAVRDGRLRRQPTRSRRSSSTRPCTSAARRRA